MADDLKLLKQLKMLQSTNCRRVKPWLQSTGPRTEVGKRKVTKNLPNPPSKISKAVQSLEKLNEAISKLQRQQERTKKRQLVELQKLEKLAKKSLD